MKTKEFWKKLTDEFLDGREEVARRLKVLSTLTDKTDIKNQLEIARREMLSANSKADVLRWWDKHENILVPLGIFSGALTILILRPETPAQPALSLGAVMYTVLLSKVDRYGTPPAVRDRNPAGICSLCH